MKLPSFAKLLQHRSKLLIFAATIIGILIINRSFPGTRSARQIEFDHYVAETQQKVDSVDESGSTTPLALPRLTMRVKTDSGTPLTYTLSPSGEVAEEKLVRVLELAKEANLFTRGDSEHERDVTLTIEQGDKHFVASLYRAEVEKSAALYNLLRLIQEYSQEQRLASSSRAVTQ